MSVDYFEEIFRVIKEKFGSSSTRDKLQIIDSTTLQLSSKLLKFGIKCRETGYGQKNMIKCVLSTDGEKARAFKVCTEGNGSSDSKLFRDNFVSYLKKDPKTIEAIKKEFGKKS